MELCDVSQPLLIRGRSLEVPIDEILWCRADFSQVRPVPTPSIGGNDQALLLHQALHDFLGDMQMAPAKCCTNSPVTVATVIALEDIGNGNPSVSVFVRTP
jgi:hypothetical protein